ncbi:MAG: TVP38/TMEM64 family protein [Anaerolineae bacterium]
MNSFTEEIRRGGDRKEQAREDIRHLWRDWPLWVGALFLAAVVGGAVLVLQEPIRTFFGSREAIALAVRRAGPWGPLVVVALELAQGLIAPIPGSAIEFASGYLFGVLRGSLYCAAGVYAGMAVNLTLSRRFGRPLVERLVPRRRLARWDALAARRGVAFFFLVYLLPFLPDDAASLLAGLSPLPLSLLFAVGVVGRLPGLVAANLIGAYGHALGPAGWAAGAGGICLLAFVSWRYQEQVEDALLQGIARLLGRPPRFLPHAEEETA